jgi:16S rRNA (cytosine967-C5)-methyltransferase
VNTLRTDIDTLQQKLEQSGVITQPLSEVPGVLVCVDGKNPIPTKWFQQGYFTIQDPASMLPSFLLEAHPDERILDMCAAPGGKALHLAELGQDQAHIFASDLQWNRMLQVRDNKERLGLERLYLFTADALQPPVACKFDAVLLDAPCSGLGTLRRNPDIKWHCTPESIARLAEIQSNLLRSAIGLCNNGGRIVYSVCTQTPEETQGVIASVLVEGQVVPEDGPEWMNTWKTAQGQYQTNLSSPALDGFFLMRLRKLS